MKLEFPGPSGLAYGQAQFEGGITQMSVASAQNRWSAATDSRAEATLSTRSSEEWPDTPFNDSGYWVFNLKKASTKDGISIAVPATATWDRLGLAAAVKFAARRMTYGSYVVMAAVAAQRQQVSGLFRQSFDHASDLISLGSKVFSLILLLCLVACAFDVYAVASQTWQNSDSVQGFFEAQSILHGNLLLSGWRLSRDNYIFTDTPFFVAYEWLFGARPEALAVVPSVIYVLIVAACLVASVSSLKLSRHNVVALATVVLLVGLPSLRVPSGDPFAPAAPLFLADFHAASILFSLVALILLVVLARAANIRDRPVVASILALVCLMAVASDPFTVVFAFGPAVLVLLSDVALSGGNRKDVGLIAIVVVSSILGMFVPALLPRLGGFETAHIISLKFVAPENLATNIQAVFFGLFYSADAYVFGKEPLNIETVAHLARLSGWTLGVVSVCWNFPQLRRRWNRSLLDRLLLASIVTLALACIFSEQFSFDLTRDIFQGGRGRIYVSPIIILGTVLIARAIPGAGVWPPMRRFRIAAQSALVAISVGLLIVHSAEMLTVASSPPWVAANPYVEVGRWLEARGLTQGVGGYFDSAIFRALTNGRVSVNAVEASSDGRLTPLTFDADAHFYRENAAPMFAIWRSGNDPFDWYHVNAETVAATYGPPKRIEQLPGGFTVEILREPPQ